MATYLTAVRAVAAVYAKRSIKIAGFILLGIFILSLLVTWLMAHYISAYWWLMLIFILPLGLLGTVTIALSLLIANIVQGKKLTRLQQKNVGEFVDKIQSIVEATQYSFGFILVVITKDLLLHRNLQTLEELISNSSTLKGDLDRLAASL